MNVQNVADRLVEFCREGKYRQAQQELYASNSVSIEPDGSPWRSAEGLKAIHAKIDQWEEMVEEIHSMNVTTPVISGNFISCKMDNDITFKGMGRINGSEIAIFEVRDGKIVREHFFYST